MLRTTPEAVLGRWLPRGRAGRGRAGRRRAGRRRAGRGATALTYERKTLRSNGAGRTRESGAFPVARPTIRLGHGDEEVAQPSAFVDRRTVLTQRQLDREAAAV